MENQQNEQNKQNYQQGQQVVGQNQQAAPDAPLEKKRRFWKFAAWFVGIIVIVLAAASLVNYLSPSARSDRELQRNYQKYQQAMSDFEAAMRADTYGGKTPQETLDMFVDALKKGDVELASKYFALDTNEQPYNRENYLTRKKWEEVLENIKAEGKIEYILQVISSAKPDLKAAISPDYFVFSARDENGTVITDVDLHLNQYSGVWKIESL